MNNPHNLPLHERGIEPKAFFNKGINVTMSKEQRRVKQARHRNNAAKRAEQSRGK